MRHEVRTICHAHAEVVDGLPVVKGLNDRPLSDIPLRIVVVLDIMPDEELALALCPEKQSKTNIVEQQPEQRVDVVHRQNSLVRYRWHEGEDHGIYNNNSQHRISGSVKRVSQLVARG